MKICVRDGCNNPLSTGKKYCSQRCWLTTWNTKGASHSKKGAKKAGETMILKFRGTGSKGYVKENQNHQHRVVASRLLQRSLHSGEVVHHEDRNKKNNDPQNLIVFSSQADHAHHHAVCYGKECTCNCIRFSELALLS